MRHSLILFFVILLTPILTFSQSDKWLVRKFKSADTLLLISHKLVAGSTDEAVDIKGNSISLPDLVIKGKLNLDILTETLIISNKQIDTLLQILDRPIMDSIVSQSGCFVPRQSIILITNHKASYIDICFHCDSYKTSKDLKNIPSFDNLKWTELREYFTTHGLAYELDKQLD